MKDYIKNNKYHLAGIFLLLLLFSTSIYVRKERLSAPLARHHEWITAHTLITAEIWSENGGPSAFSFNPVYSYPGKGNEAKRMLGGITDKNGIDYYVSYPPFAFYLAYYSNEIMGGSAVTNIRIISLLIHLMCTLLIYFIIRQISSDYKRDRFHLAAVFGGFLYIFSTANLWIHGNLYFADMVEQMLFLTCMLLLIRLLKGEFKSEKKTLILIALFFFLATYTEWLGLFFSLYSGLTLLIFYFLKKNKIHLKAFIIIGIASGLGLSMTIIQYSSIVDFETFKEASLSKYDQRSGHLSEEETNNVFNMHSEHSYLAIEKYMSRGFKMGENFIGIVGILIIAALIYRRTRIKMKNIKWKLIPFVVLFLSILTHYILFFNFNAIHDFSILKTGALLILTISLLILIIEEAMEKKFIIALGVVLGGISIPKGLESIDRYYDQFKMEEVDVERLHSADKIRQFAEPESAVYTNVRLSPEQVYYAKHNIFPVKDTSYIKVFMNNFQDNSVQYYHHEGSKLMYMLKYEKDENGEVQIVDKIIFNMDYQNDNTHHFQK